MDEASYGLSLIATGEKILADPSLRFECTAGELSLVTVELLNNYACIATELGDFEKSYEKFQAALDCYNKSSKRNFKEMREYTLYGGIANSLDGLGRHAEAEELYRKCLELKPDNEEEELNVYEINICRAMQHQKTPEKLQSAGEGLLDYLDRLHAKYGTLEKKDYL